MAEYSRMASGVVTSTGGQTAVVIPFIPSYIEISNLTRLSGSNSGVSRAWWETDLGQGAAFLTTTTNATSDLTSFIDATGGSNSTSGNTAGTGFTTIKAGLSLQYGPTVLLGTSGGAGIAKTSATTLTVTTAAAHGLTTGNWVIFQNLYQTATTGMQQIAGIPFLVTVTGTTTFTIQWVGNNSNLTAITTAATGAAAFKQILYPVLYAPGVAYPWKITTGTTTTVFTTAPHNFVAGQEIAFRIPTAYGMTQLNSLPNVAIPGSPIYGYVTSVVNSTEFICNINSTAFTAFTTNLAFTSFPGQKFAQVLAVGDVNTGGFPYTGAALYPSPTVFNGFTSSTSTGVSTINGPAIQGAFFNATFQGFVIGTGICGTAADLIYWRAYLHDMNL